MKKTSIAISIIAALLLGATAQAEMINNIDDVPNKEGGTANITVLDTTHPLFSGIDDTYSGNLEIKVTINFDAHRTSSFTGFQLYDRTTQRVGLGTYFNGTAWGGYKALGNFELKNEGSTLSVAINDPQTYTMNIIYVAGGLDSGTISIAGGYNYTMDSGDYSFDSIVVRNGSSAAASTADFTDMTVETVPEPATAGLLGISGLILFGIRRLKKTYGIR